MIEISVIYAIDYGTTNSLLAAATPDGPGDPIPLDPGARDPSILRSVLYFPNRKTVFYGSEAIQEFTRQDLTGRLIRSIKKFLPMRSFIGTFIEDRPMNLEDIIAVFLAEMRRRANTHFGRDVDSVLLGRPARFSPVDEDDQYAQYRLERAARTAGFKHIEFCPEPIAAAQEFRSTLEGEKLVLVGDYGGGTSDFTVIRLRPSAPGQIGGHDKSDVLAIGGVSIAGDALDGAVMRKRISKHFGADVQYKVPFGSNILTMPPHLMEKICSPADISLLRERDTREFFNNVREWSLGAEDRAKMDRLFQLIDDQIGFDLFEEIERTKRTLSDAGKAEFHFDRPGIRIVETLSRRQFDEYTEEQVGKILSSLDQTVIAAGLKPKDIDLVCSTGGTAKVAAIREGMEERFGVEKVREHRHFQSIVSGLSRIAQATLN